MARGRARHARYLKYLNVYVSDRRATRSRGEPPQKRTTKRNETKYLYFITFVLRQQVVPFSLSLFLSFFLLSMRSLTEGTWPARGERARLPLLSLSLSLSVHLSAFWLFCPFIPRSTFPRSSGESSRLAQTCGPDRRPASASGGQNERNTTSRRSDQRRRRRGLHRRRGT